ncbi:hypothetical protein [Metabacillus sp. 84]|uniref:hypothetical protein n=1 Tax=Metabacillus sp. 84 TaxID=3404705 RepID=UPI003CEE9AC1
MGKSRWVSRRETKAELAKLIGGERKPLSGALGGKYSNDVEGLGMEFEVKARKEGFKTLYNWLLDEREKPDALALKADRKPWLVVMTLDKFKELMKHVE